MSSKQHILAPTSTAASTSALLHTPLCTNDLQVQMLLSGIESKPTTSIASMISQALVPLRTFVVDQINALSHKTSGIALICWRQKSTITTRTILLQSSLLFQLLTNPLLVNLLPTQIILSNQRIMQFLLMNESSTLLFMVSKNVPMVPTGQIESPMTLIMCPVLF